MGLMLDDLKYIHERDAQDALGIAGKQWQQLQQTYELPQIKHEIENIVYAGMGGSALAAQISLSWPGYRLPFEIVRNYTTPGYVNEKTLFIASSYSGNTEETLSALTEAEQKGAHIAVITSGGKLAEIAMQKNYPLVKLPTGYQPRHATLYNLRGLVTILERAGLVAAEQAENTMHQTVDYLKNNLASWLPTVPTARNQAKQIAQELTGKSVVIYSGPALSPAAYKWKISINENAKQIAWCNQLPEFNHNEMLGWTQQPVQKPYAVINLRSSLEHSRVQKRFEVTGQLLSGKLPAPIVVEAQGATILQQLLWVIALGDFVSIYLALLNGVNPTPVDLIEKFKTSLSG
jgi:glucose/mannose-6-phosphate isomerase